MIKAVDEIPMSKAKERKSYREQIKTDLMEAITSGIKRFEFVGDYNYKYLAQYVREEADKLMRVTFCDVAARHRGEFENIRLNWYMLKPRMKYFTVTSIRTEEKDKPRVFCEMVGGNLEEYIYNAIRQADADRAAVKRFRDELKEDEA